MMLTLVHATVTALKKSPLDYTQAAEAVERIMLDKVPLPPPFAEKDLLACLSLFRAAQHLIEAANAFFEPMEEI